MKGGLKGGEGEAISSEEMDCLSKRIIMGILYQRYLHLHALGFWCWGAVLNCVGESLARRGGNTRCQEDRMPVNYSSGGQFTYA